MQKFSFQLSADPEKESNFWTCRDASVTRKTTKILLLLLFYESRQRKKPNTVYDDTRRPQGSAFRNKEQQCRNDWPMSYPCYLGRLVRCSRTLSVSIRAFI